MDSFAYTKADALSICFTTTQGLHGSLWQVRENGLSKEDFSRQATVFISDEAHHLNADTKRMTKGEREDYHSWQETVERVFGANDGNILLEFTATAGLTNPAVREKYEEAVVFDYPLQKFYADGYSKDILTMRSDLPPMDRALQAVVMSQYRLKLFEAHRISVRPVVLFKARNVEESRAFMADFVRELEHIHAARLEALRGAMQQAKSQAIEQAFSCFEAQGITMEALAAELRDDFSALHCVSVNDEAEAKDRQILLNTLEDMDNPYRAIFEVKKLDEGWDVLNLFDIVRLYETRQSSGKRISPTTISEAQLIGRGARYCPFQVGRDEARYRRKYDSDTMHAMRVCETLYYHCQNDSRYVAELHGALRGIGLDVERAAKCTDVLKDSFVRDSLRQTGRIFVNERRERNRQACMELAEEVRARVYRYRVPSGALAVDALWGEGQRARDAGTGEEKLARCTIAKMAGRNYAIVHKALRQCAFYTFTNLKQHFPALPSMRAFILGTSYLGDVQVEIVGTDVPSNEVLFCAAREAASQIAEALQADEAKWNAGG